MNIVPIRKEMSRCLFYGQKGNWANQEKPTVSKRIMRPIYQ